MFGIASRPFADSLFNRFPANCGVRKGQFAEMFHFKLLKKPLSLNIDVLKFIDAGFIVLLKETVEALLEKR